MAQEDSRYGGQMKTQIALRVLAVCLMIGIIVVLLAQPLQRKYGPSDRGKKLYQDGMYDAAAAAYREALQANPADITAATELGRSLLAEHHTDEAIQCLTATVRRIPSAMDAWQMLGEAYTSNRQPAQAVDAFQHVLELEPTRVHTHLMLGQVYINMGKKKEALAELQRVIALDPVNEGQLAQKMINLSLPKLR